MKKQTVMCQVKGEGEPPEQLSEVGISHFPGKNSEQGQRRIWGKRRRRRRRCVPKPRRTKEQTETSDTLEGISSRITEAREQINDLEDRMVKSLPQNGIQKKG